MTTVRTPKESKPTPTVSFTVSPTAGSFAYAVGATVYNMTDAPLINIATPITFTATVTFPSSVNWATSYEWDFGDGVKGYGNLVTHSYVTANPHTQAVLTVIDNDGNRLRARKQLYLQ